MFTIVKLSELHWPDYLMWTEIFSCLFNFINRRIRTREKNSEFVRYYHLPVIRCHTCQYFIVCCVYYRYLYITSIVWVGIIYFITFTLEMFQLYIAYTLYIYNQTSNCALIIGREVLWQLEWKILFQGLYIRIYIICMCV